MNLFPRTFRLARKFGRCKQGGYKGAPIYVLMGPGDQTPSVTGAALTVDGTPVDTCVFDETTYFNLDAQQQAIGRRILDARDSIVILPRNPLVPDKTYTVGLAVNGTTLTWSFQTIMPPQ